MVRTSTVVWRFGVLALLAASVPIGIHVYEAQRQVDVEDMLDVSVSIKTITHVRIDQVGDSVWQSRSGSGFLVDKANCTVWTNHHVIDNAAVIEVFPRSWSADQGVPATVVRATPHPDLAVLHMEHCEMVAAAKLGDSNAIRQGDDTYAVGNPLGKNPDSISRGIVSHTERYVDDATPYLQTDAVINPGNSGGALFNYKGEVIGINTAIAATRSGGNLGISYAIPINLALEVASQLEQGPPSWANPGIYDIAVNLSMDEAVIFGVPPGRGAVGLIETPENGPGAGKLYDHDVIVEVDGAPVDNLTSFKRLIAEHSAGDTVTLMLFRDGEPIMVELALTEGWKPEEMHDADYYEGYLGMTLTMWDQEDGEKSKFKTPVITQVHSLGPAHRARIASSQNNILRNGMFELPYIMDVKTITGVVRNGRYQAIGDIITLNNIAACAHAEGEPLLLEIEIWMRTNLRDPRTPLEHTSTAFYRVSPKPTTAPSMREVIPNEPGDAIAAHSAVKPVGVFCGTA